MYTFGNVPYFSVYYPLTPIPLGEVTGKPAFASTKKLGSEARVWLMQGEHAPPEGFLPDDAQVRRLDKTPAMCTLPACVQSPTVEADRDGSTLAWRAWPGLGKVPEGLPQDFRLVLFCGDSGSGKTTALRTLLRERFPRSLQIGSLVTIPKKLDDFLNCEGVRATNLANRE